VGRQPFGFAEHSARLTPSTYSRTSQIAEVRCVRNRELENVVVVELSRSPASRARCAAKGELGAIVGRSGLEGDVACERLLHRVVYVRQWSRGYLLDHATIAENLEDARHAARL